MSCLRLLLPLLAIILTACTHAISREGRQAVDPQVTLAMVQADPQAHVGQTLLLGGVIVAPRPEEKATEILHWRLDRFGEPAAIADDAGRFLLRPAIPLDPATYPPGRLVTLTATVVGHKILPLGPNTYDYPILTPVEIHPWVTPFRYLTQPHLNPYLPTYVGPEDPPRDNPYDPGYHAYPYTPYWLRGYVGE